MRADRCNVIPTYLSLAPCSGPSRPGPAGGRQERPALTAPARGALHAEQAGTKERLTARTKELLLKEKAMT
jgi:hypothetical protein